MRGAGSSGDDGANDVTTDSRGNIYLCGYFSGVTQFDDLQIVGGGFFIAKYDPNGQILWVKQIAESDNLGKSLALMTTGDLVATGVFENTATFGNTLLTGKGQTDIFVTKLDTVTVTSISDQSSSVPHKAFLAQNYPNPFNPKTIIYYELSISSFVELSIYNILGEQVTILVSEKQNAGYHQVEWDAGHLSSGVYLYQLVTWEYREIKKMILLR